MTNHKYIKLSLAQATWAHQAGVEVFNLVDKEFHKIENYSEIYHAPCVCLKLNNQRRELEMELQADYSSKITFYVMGIVICLVLGMIQYFSGMTAWVYCVAISCFLFVSIFKTSKEYYSQRKNRFEMYLVGSFH